MSRDPSELAYHNREIDRRYRDVCGRILTGAVQELYVSMRYLDLALSALEPEWTTEYPGIGTDGRLLYVHPQILMDLYERNRLLVNRVYLHTVLHCLLRHPFKRPREDVLLWEIACDVAVEAVIDSLRQRSVRMGVPGVRMNWYDLLRSGGRILTAENVYRFLAGKELSEFERQALWQAFHMDDHSLWPGNGSGEKPPIALQIEQDRWQDIAEKTQTQMESFGDQAGESGADEELPRQIRAELERRYDYRSFLRRFAALHEELHADPDSFDYVFYTYGLQLYENMPLIEPLESREVERIRDFVIVIDVSMSTRGELVRSFLNQTCEVLKERETYLNRVHIRIIQCDDAVREDVAITCREELDSYMRNFTLHGGGGTDFRPAFAHVRGLLEQGVFSGLKGMIYFTDGKGRYPKQKPPWDTAFVFLEEDYRDVNVPPWAIKLILPMEQLEEPKRLRDDFTFVAT